MKAMAIRNVLLACLLLILCSCFVSALEINIEHPDEIKILEETAISVDADVSESYDVKIYAYSGEKFDKESEIYDSFENKWKSSYYYLKSVFPENKEFKIRVKENAETGEGQVCVKLRKSGGSSFSEKCEGIEIINADSEEEVEQEEIMTEKSEYAGNAEEKGVVKKEIEEISNENNEVIFLNSPKNEEKRAFVSAEERVRNWAIYGFIGFVIFIAILVVLRRI